MIRNLGPLLRRELDEVTHAFVAADVDYNLFMAAREGLGRVRPADAIPVVLKIPTVAPTPGEGWSSYRDRAAEACAVVARRVEADSVERPRVLIAANSVAAELPLDTINALLDSSEVDVELMELDPVLPVVQMNDALDDTGVAAYRAAGGTLDGSGVTVAVLDTGVDVLHPFLNVHDSVSTCGSEGVEVPGEHGTHCAGSLASTDAAFPGVAPGVTLLNVKVLRANGTGSYSDITAGVDVALDREAKVLSMSVGFNHRPRWSPRGHGWACADGGCPLCTAVDNAVMADGAIAVVAAGNEHAHAQALFSGGHGNSYDTELACPGQARGAITVGAHTKTSFAPAYFSSCGPTSYGHAKPDLTAPGVNITSTAPAPRLPDGSVDGNAPRNALFRQDSGTSMATPIVAGVVALLLQRAMDAGLPTDPASVRAMLLADAVEPLAGPPNVVGAGRLAVGTL